ncbi:metallophosphoesterase [Orbus mooreae]|uniref:metallophosphoesterase n=1 Tax=Orbus mooreae TaxID=3074107 RepID=UPI00370D817F
MGWFFVVALITSLIIAFYLGFRVINLFNLHQQGYADTLAKKVFWVVILFGSLSFILSRALAPVSDYWLPLIGNITFSLTLCFFYSIIIIDIIRLFCFLLFKKTVANNSTFGYSLQILSIVIAIAMFLVGLYMASNPRVIEYQINIDKPAKVESLKIVQLSDIHISETTSRHFLRTMIKDVNSLYPDYIFITGDTLDLRLKPYLDNNFAELFAQLKPTYGTFIIFGNHEHYGIAREQNNSNADIINAFSSGNMLVLQDNVFYDDKTGITIVGRDDYVVNQLDKSRLDLTDLLNHIDINKPIILLDHQPKNLEEPEILGVDLMYSGHTHAGQIFPMTLIVNAMYENPWGVYQSTNKNNNFTSIVSSGYSLWGPPIRLMTRAEIVITEIKFNQDKVTQH